MRQCCSFFGIRWLTFNFAALSIKQAIETGLYDIVRSSYIVKCVQEGRIVSLTQQSVHYIFFDVEREADADAGTAIMRRTYANKMKSSALMARSWMKTFRR